MEMILNGLVTVVNHLGLEFWGHAAAMFVQSGILILLLFIIDFVLRRRVKAVFRYGLWMLVFAKLVLPTSFAFPTGVGYWLGEWWPGQEPVHERVVTTEQTPLFVLAEQPLAPHLVRPLPEVTAPNPVATVPPERSEPIPDRIAALHWQVWLFLIWAAGALVLSSLLIRRTNSVRRLLAGSIEADGRLKDLLDRCRGRVGLTRNVRLRLSSQTVSPAVCGLVRPTILLPRRAVTKLPVDKLRLVLIHELVHIKRADVGLNLVQTVLQVIYFYNPLLWLANARVRRLREQAVDETVLAGFAKQADSYSDMLLDIAEMAFRRPNLSLRLVGVVEPRKALGRRIQHIMRRPMPKSAKVGVVGLAAIVLVGAVLLPMAKAGKPAVLRVAADGSAAYASIQKAIDAAPEGAVIRIAPGIYEERLQIKKPLTLEGAGWDETTITAENAVADEFENMRRAAMQRVRAAKSQEEAKRMGSEFEAELAEKFASMQTVLAHDTERVAICNLKLTSPGRQLEGRTLGVPVLEFRNAKARMSGCVIAGNPGNGIHVTDGSDVEIRDSLVAGVWGTGIVVGHKGGKPCSVRVLDSDLRNCHYAGIVIRPGNDSTLIQRCRISGAAWHGIRYDDASPTIVGNLVFGNARCGIYASGKTTATVKQNLFYGNEMTGISCWFQNQDTIEQNSFVDNKRSGLEVLGASKPIVRKNIFYANPAGVSRGNIASDSPFAESDGVVALQDSLFWHNERNVVRRRPATAGGESTTEDISLNEQAHNVQADPLFVGVENKNFALAPNSPARRSGVGAADPIGFDSPWPLQDEEIAIIPEGDTRDWRQWKKQPAATARATKAVASQQDKVTPAVKGKLQQMIDQARPGETVVIPKGIYTEPVDIRKSLTLKGQSRTECVFEVTANRPAIFVDAKNKGAVSIENVTVKWQLATSERCEYPAAVAVKDTTANVRHCCFLPLGDFKRCPVAINSVGFSKLSIDTCRFEGFEFTVCFGPNTEGTIQGCLVMDSGHQGISLYSGTNASIIGNIVTGSKFHAVRSTGGTLHMKDNLIIENANRGVYLGNRSASGTITNNVILGNGTGISGFARSNVKIENNIIADSSYAGVGMRSSCSLLIRNNILKGNQRALIMFAEGGSGGNKIERNLFWQNATDAENLDKPASSITADPLFVDPDQGDFSLRSGPALENQQGLTNPRVFRLLWDKWKNRADKNQPFIGEAVPTKVGDGDKSSRADKPGGTGYAWQATDRYIPPDFEGFFPDDPEGSKDLQSLWQSADKDQRSDAEILSIVRRGFRCYQGDRGNIVRWIGNRTIWGKTPQNPEAIEIMYHASDIDDYGTSYFAVYFGLSVVRSKTPAILRRLAEMGVQRDDPNILHRIAWGCSSQKEQLLAYLKPHLKSDQRELRAKAEVFARIVRGELNAFRWAGEKRRARRYAELIEQMPEYKGTSIEELISKYNRLVADLTEESARYRASSPVFEEYADLTRKFVVPWGLQGEKARLKLVELVEREPEFWKTVEYDQEAVQNEIGKVLAPLYQDIAAHMKQLEFYDTFVRGLDQQGTINLNAALHVVAKYGDTGEIRDSYTNPFEEGSWQHVHFERDLGGALMMLHASFGTILAKLPPALEKKKEQAQQLHELIANHPSAGDAERAAKYVDAYIDSLEKEYQKIGEYTEQYWKERKQAEREAEPAKSVSETAAATTYEKAFADLHEELGRNYPCFELKGIDWKKVGEELLPRAKDIRTDKEFGLLCIELIARLEDSHAYLMKAAAEVPEVSFPRWDPGFACLMDDRGKPVVYHIDRGGPANEAGVKVGMTVLSVNGETADEYMRERMKQIKKYSGYSSDRYLRYHAAQWLGRQVNQGATVELKMQGVGGQTHTFELPATLGVRYLPRRPVQVPGTSDTADVSWTRLNENVGYIYVRRIRGDLIEKLDQAVGELKDARGLIVDVRGNSGGGFDSRRSHRNFAPDDREEPDRPRFAGPIALLIDARCISAGEGWASWFIANKRSRMFGEATAGASSRKTVYTLTNGLFKVQYPVKAYRGYLDRPIERRGLEPDVLVRQNAGDLAAGRDTVLEMAKRYLLEQ